MLKLAGLAVALAGVARADVPPLATREIGGAVVTLWTERACILLLDVAPK